MFFLLLPWFARLVVVVFLGSVFFAVVAGLSIFVIFTTFFISVFFVLKYFNILSSSSSKNSDAVANMEYRGYQ